MTPTEHLLCVYCRYLSNGNLSTATESPTASEESPEEWTMTNNNCLHHGHRSELSLCDLGTWDWALWSRSTPHPDHLALTLAVSTLRAASALITMRGISGVDIVDNADHRNN